MKMFLRSSLLFILLPTILLAEYTNKSSIEEYFLGDLEAHIALRTRTKSSITRAVHDLLNPDLNSDIFDENGNTVTIIYENDGTDTNQREQHDLIYAFLHPLKHQQSIKYYLIHPLTLKDVANIHRSSLNILLVDSAESFFKIYEYLQDFNFRNDAYYLVILNYQDADWFTVAKRIFSKAWQRYMINISLMFLSNTEDDVKIFTYFPYTEAHCEQVEPVLIQSIRDGKWHNVNTTIFPEKLKNFHGCPIKVALLHTIPFMFIDKLKQFGDPMKNLEGIEAYLLKTLARTYNFNIEPVIVTEWGFVKRVNRTADGAIEALREKRANMTLGLFGISEERNSEITPGFPYHTAKLIFVIPPEHKPISRLTKPLSKTVRIAVISTFCFGALVIFISSKLHQRWNHLLFGRDNHHPYLNLFITGISGGLTKTPFNNFARFCLISWILLCFVVNNFYLAKYFQFLAQDDEISLADTFEKIGDRKYTVYIRPTCKEFFDEHPKLAVNVKILPLPDYPRVERLLQDPDTSAVLMHTSDIVVYKNKKMYWEKPLIIAAQPLIKVQSSIYYPNNSLLRHAFNPFLQKITSNGMFGYWHKKYVDPMYLVNTLKADHGEMVITIAHLTDIYWVVIAGWIWALFVFLLEILSVKFVFLRRLFQ